MPQPVLSREQVREVDRRAIAEYGVSSLVLMENAGRGVVDRLFQFGIQGPVAICCGKGNNAGDGFVIARHLDLRYVSTRVLLFAEPETLTSDAQANYQILARANVEIEVLGTEYDSERLAQKLDGAGWIVDALLGTGARGAPRPPMGQVIEHLNRHSARRLAVDLPSGLDCDTGEPGEPTFQAEHTCTFVASKPGFSVPGASDYTGAVHILDIGAPRCLVEEILAGA